MLCPGPSLPHRTSSTVAHPLAIGRGPNGMQMAQTSSGAFAKPPYTSVNSQGTVQNAGAGNRRATRTSGSYGTAGLWWRVRARGTHTADPPPPSPPPASAPHWLNPTRVQKATELLPQGDRLLPGDEWEWGPGGTEGPNSAPPPRDCLLTRFLSPNPAGCSPNILTTLVSGITGLPSSLLKCLVLDPMPDYFLSSQTLSLPPLATLFPPRSPRQPPRW